MRSKSHTQHTLDKKRILPLQSHWLLHTTFLYPLWPPPFFSINRIPNPKPYQSLPSSLSQKNSIFRQNSAMASTIATMAMINAKCLTSSATKPINLLKPTTKPISLPSLPTLQKPISLSSSLTGTALAGAFFASLSTSEPAMAAQQIAEIADGDNRGIALLLPLIPALAWVLFNILQPALNQINRMRNSKGVMIGVGLGGLAASGLVGTTPEASAAAVSEIAEAAAVAAGSDNRGQLLLIVVAPALAWVLFNILQPALNQLNRMRSE